MLFVPVMLAPVVVEGEKLSRERFRTYASVGVTTAEEIETYAIESLDQALQRLPNVTSKPDGSGDANIVIRGLNAEGVTQPSRAAPIISVIVDGAQQGVEATRRGSRGLFDVEQVEVLRGPQSTLQGRNALGEIAQLISGGEHYVNATQNGEDLELDGAFMLQVNAETTGGPDSEMGLFRPDPVDGAWIEQEADPEAFGIGRMPGADGKGTVDTYWLTSGEFGWTNIDKWYNDPRPKTEIHVQVPEGYDPENCGVYLAYAGEGSALARFDTWDSATNRFGEHYGLIPIGLDVHVIFVTESEGLWSYAIQSETITEDHLTLFDASEPLSTGTMDELSAAINALP